MIIILNGITGSGKSTLGRSIAKSLKYNFIDLDNYLEISQSKTIALIFEEHGEEHFRTIERQCLNEVLLINYNKNLILSLGGGTFKNNANVDLCLSKGIVIWIDMAIDALLVRLKDLSSRPLLKNSTNLKETIQQLLTQRTPNYQKSHIKVSFDKNYPTKYMAQQLLIAIHEYLIKNKLGAL